MRRPVSRVPALSLWNPHAGLMAIGAKSVETRGQRFAVTGPLAIASTLSVPAEHRMWARNLCYRNPAKAAIARGGWESFADMPGGCILALVWVVSEVVIDQTIRDAVRRDFGADEIEFGFYDDGRVAMITDPARRIRLPEPVRVKGKQGKYFLDRTARTAIRAQLDDVPAFRYYRAAFDLADAGEIGDSVPTAAPTPT